MPYGEPLKFWRFPEYAAYLKRYAAHFGVDRRICFGHGLQSMKRLPTRQLLSFTLLAFVAGLAIFGFFSFDPQARCRLRASAQLPE